MGMSPYTTARRQPKGRRAIGTSRRPTGPDLLALKAQEFNDEWMDSRCGHGQGCPKAQECNNEWMHMPRHPNHSYPEPATTAYHDAVEDSTVYSNPKNSRYFDTQPSYPSFEEEASHEQDYQHQDSDFQTRMSYGMDTNNFVNDVSEMRPPNNHQGVTPHQSQAEVFQKDSVEGMDESELQGFFF